MFSQPEEKLWLVVKHYNGSLEKHPGATFDGRKGIKLEKNSIIKMGRVRMRVRDIDYAEDIKPIAPILSSPPKQKQAQSPQKKTNTTSKLKGSKQKEEDNQAENDQGIDLNEIKLIEEAQIRVAAITAGRNIEKEEAL